MEVYADLDSKDMFVVGLNMPESKSRFGAEVSASVSRRIRSSKPSPSSKCLLSIAQFQHEQDAAWPIQKVVSSVWKAVRLLEDRPAPTSKVKLPERLGYGDGDIPAPGRTPDRD